MTVINSNISALRAQSSMTTNAKSLSTAMERLSTGTRINSAADDAAGLAISTRMTSDIRGLAVAIRNANDGISLAQTAEGAIGEVTNILQRMRELSVQSSNGTLSTDNRAAMQVEFSQLTAQIDNISSTTNFNGIKLLDGSSSNIQLQTGVREGDTVSLGLQKTDSKALGLAGSATVGMLNSGRIVDQAAVTNTVSPDFTTLAADDIKINGYNWTTSAATFASGDGAAQLASAINLNTGAHRVQATASNSLTGVAPDVTSFAKGDLTVNGQDIGAAASLSELVANINRDAPGVTATLNSDNTISLNNNTGKDIVIGGPKSTDAGFVAKTYTGFISLNSLDSTPISITANDKPNGFAANTGTAAMVESLGFNETASSGAISGTAIKASDATAVPPFNSAITLDDDIRINGIKLSPSDDGSALSKANAINAISDQTKVTALATTSVTVSLDLTAPTTASAASNPLKVSINGSTIDFTTAGPGGNPVKNIADVVSAINGAGINGVVAKADTAGNLVLTATTGADIKLENVAAVGQTDQLFTEYSEPDSVAPTAMVPNTAVSVQGRLTLQSLTGGLIRVEDFNNDQTVQDKLGLSPQNVGAKGGGALSISDQNNAQVAITAIDHALNTVNLQRANLGAMQNRLEAAVNSLTSASTNMSAARSRILDTDYGLETTALSKAQVIQQAASAMLAQANQQPQQILSLLKQ